MKSFVLLLPLFASLAAAAGIAVGPLPAPECADTEVSTNFVFSFGEGQSRGIVFAIELQATSSNNVEVAIGVDADEDGRLSLDESELCVGYDCGTWLVRSASDDAITTTDAADSGVFRRTYRVRARRVNPLWNLVKVTRRGIGAAAESVSVEHVEHGFKMRLLQLRGQVMPVPTTQRFEIDGNGVMSVRKYGHEIIRAPDNRVWVDGVQRN